MEFPCRESKIQEYDCCVGYKPFFATKSICFDKCLASELFYLWDLGIETTGCCCGHGKLEPYIGVKPKYIKKMKELGYKVKFNSCRPDDKDSFIPKTKLK